jgi:hypothetical protein
MLTTMSNESARPLDPKVLEVVLDEAQRIDEDAKHSAKSHFEAADIWAYRNLCIGIPTTLLAAVAGVSALTKFPVLGGILALLAAGASAVQTFLRPGERSAGHLKAGNGYKGLQNDVRIFRTIECVQRATDPTLVEELKSLSQRRNTLNTESLQCSRKAFERARRGIEQGEATYAVDAARRPAAL